LASQQPVLMIFEDVHWIDPTSLEALNWTVDRMKALPVLLVVTFRPEFNAPWVGQPHVTTLTLNRLGERDTAAIIERLIGNKELPADVMTEIVERTDGIPLFVEEMTKAVLEAESEAETRRTVAMVPSSTLAVPATLHASLMARLDRLGQAKEIAQVGAAIGREFSHALLAAVASKPEAELNSALDRLMAAGLLFRQGVPPHATYHFKHARAGRGLLHYAAGPSAAASFRHRSSAGRALSRIGQFDAGGDRTTIRASGTKRKVRPALAAGRRPRSASLRYEGIDHALFQRAASRRGHAGSA
jgi:predicted ATPase